MAVRMGGGVLPVADVGGLLHRRGGILFAGIRGMVTWPVANSKAASTSSSAD
jgi:hypothetical protein